MWCVYGRVGRRSLSNEKDRLANASAVHTSQAVTDIRPGL